MLETLGEKKVLKDFESLAQKIVHKYPYTATLVKQVSDSPELTKTWLDKLKDDAQSFSFATANRFAESIPDIDGLLVDLDPKDAFELVVGVCTAAKHGAFTSRDLRSARFAPTPQLRQLARKHVDKHPTTAGKLLGKADVASDLDTFVTKYLTEAEEE
jgi:hypothetical protein